MHKYFHCGGSNSAADGGDGGDGGGCIARIITTTALSIRLFPHFAYTQQSISYNWALLILPTENHSIHATNGKYCRNNFDRKH